ncbi:hypothetical protein V8G54_023664 [Vigna mungo]|uniref:Peptidase A1 domain-containing protein n=1 Tax=Vigna mungo TaxID=3915 RepID=A0AAQ3N444_VIGMU
MIHRDSPKSPFYRPNETHFQRVENAILRSIHRANYFNIDSNDVDGTITPVSGEYLVNYSVGTPPVQILGIVDTGSRFIWMQCQPCKNCYKEDRPIFDPSTSRTYSPIPCVAAECLSSQNAFCDFNNKKHCAYKVSYGDGSTSEGDFSWDTITLTSSFENVPVAFPQTIIGCGHNNVGTFGGQGSGVVGLGNAPFSLAGQLKPKTGGTFSYCLTPMYQGNPKPSYLHFGDAGEVTVKEAVTTPLIINKARPTKYYVVMEAISVGSKRIEFPINEDGNIFIDSGTTLTNLPDEVYSSLEGEMVNAVKLRRTNSPVKPLKLCYEITPGEEYHLPLVYAHFKGGGTVTLYEINTFIKVRETIICLAFRSGKQPIFGNLAQQDILVGYDTQQNTIKFLNTDCTSELSLCSPILLIHPPFSATLRGYADLRESPLTFARTPSILFDMALVVSSSLPRRGNPLVRFLPVVRYILGSVRPIRYTGPPSPRQLCCRRSFFDELGGGGILSRCFSPDSHQVRLFLKLRGSASRLVMVNLEEGMFHWRMLIFKYFDSQVQSGGRWPFDKMRMRRVNNGCPTASHNYSPSPLTTYKPPKTETTGELVMVVVGASRGAAQCPSDVTPIDDGLSLRFLGILWAGKDTWHPKEGYICWEIVTSLDLSCWSWESWTVRIHDRLGEIILPNFIAILSSAQVIKCRLSVLSPLWSRQAEAVVLAGRLHLVSRRVPTVTPPSDHRKGRRKGWLTYRLQMVAAVKLVGQLQWSQRGGSFTGPPLFLVQGGVTIDPVALAPVGSLPRVDDYDCAGFDANTQVSCFSRTGLQDFIDQSYVVRDTANAQAARVVVSRENERVCHGKGSSSEDYFFMYANLFTQQNIRVPFTDFQMELLRELNVAPTQLHPNSWAAAQAFVVECMVAGVSPTVRSFLHYFDVRPSPKGGWVSLISVASRTLFKPYFESFKSFKDQFFKVVVADAGRRDFFDPEGSPLYWTENPRKLKAYAKHDLEIEHLCVVDIIETLPRHTSARCLVDCIPFEDCAQRALDCMASPGPRQSNFLAAKRESARAATLAKDQALPPPKRPPSSATRVTIASFGLAKDTLTGGINLTTATQAPAVGSIPISSNVPSMAAGSNPVAEVASQSAPIPASASFKRKRKSQKGGKSSSTKCRRESIKPAVPLPGGVFSPEYNVSRFIDFNRGPAYRTLLESLPGSTMLDSIFEMASRTALMIGYVRDVGDFKGLGEVKRSLLKEQEKTAALEVELEGVRKTLQEERECTATASTKLEETAKQLKEEEAAKFSLEEECTQLKLEATEQKEIERRLQGRTVELHNDLSAVRADLKASQKRISEFNDTLVVVLLKVDKPLELGFDLYKDVYDGVLMEIEPSGTAAVGDDADAETVAGSTSAAVENDEK